MKFFIVLLLIFAAMAGAQTEAPPKPFTKIWLKNEIVPMNFAWSDLSLSREASFTRPIGDAWEKWLKENLPATVGDAKLCVEDCLRFEREWQERSVEAKLGEDSLGEYAGGVWLQVTVNLWRHLDPFEGPRFRWQGRVVLSDVATKRVMANYSLGPYERNLPGLTGGELNSALGNQLYRSLLSRLKDVTLSLEKGQRLNQTSFVKVRGHRHLLDAMELKNLLQSRGTQLGLEVKLEGFGKDEVTLLCYYRGEEKSFTDLLSQLKELKSSESYTLSLGSEEDVPLLQLKAR